MTLGVFRRENLLWPKALVTEPPIFQPSRCNLNYRSVLNTDLGVIQGPGVLRADGRQIWICDPSEWKNDS